MQGIWGDHLQLAIFGESHGPAIGITISGFPAGFPVDLDHMTTEMGRRQPGRDDLSTPRKEADAVDLVSGVFQGKTTGAPITLMIPNTNTRSKDYARFHEIMRPGQTDYSGICRYDGCNDYRGSGHFSGRLTAPLVAAGSLCQQWLRQKGVHISGHIYQIGQVKDRPWSEEEALTPQKIEELKTKRLPLYQEENEEAMRQEILAAKADQDSIGGQVELVVLGLPAGYGDPFFDSLESRLAHLIFSVPGIKGLEFGSGFALAGMRGSKANDGFRYEENGQLSTTSHHNGGIIGGVSLGQPIVFRVVVKPTASIGLRQQTVNLKTKENVELVIEGRHDPCIVPRVVPVLEAVTSIALMETYMTRISSAGGAMDE